MKPRRLVLATTALALPFGAWAQTSGSSQSVIGSQPQPPSHTTVKHVRHEELSHGFTARDLIGKNVVNHDGERLGTINDVGLSHAWTQRFGAATQESNPAQPASRNVGSTGIGQSTPTAVSSAPGSDLLVYVSTGGVLGLGGRLGMGADWVSVSADSLLYDRVQDRFILNMSPAQFTSIAKGSNNPSVYAAKAGGAETGSGTTVASTGPAVVNRPASSGTTTGSGEFETYDPNAHRGSSAGTIGGVAASTMDSGEVRRIEDALRDASDLRDRSRIQVSHTGSAIQLSGTVEDAELIRRAGDIARQHTRLEVRNLLEVRRTAE